MGTQNFFFVPRSWQDQKTSFLTLSDLQGCLSNNILHVNITLNSYQRSSISWWPLSTAQSKVVLRELSEANTWLLYVVQGSLRFFLCPFREAKWSVVFHIYSQRWHYFRAVSTPSKCLCIRSLHSLQLSEKGSAFKHLLHQQCFHVPEVSLQHFFA